LKVLITGISGLLGHACAAEGLRRRYSVAGVQHRADLRFESIQTFKTDLTNYGAAQQVLAEVKPDWIVHCAALTNVDYCESHEEEAVRINSVMSASLSESAERYGSRFLYVSTDSVFDGAKGGYTEEDHPSPLNVYARSKLLGESAVLRNQASLVVRTTIFGWNVQPKLSLAEWMLRELQCGRKIGGFVDLIFNPLLTTVCAGLMFDLMLSGAHGIYHLAGSSVCSKHQFACELAREFGLDPALITECQSTAVANRVIRPRNTSLKTEKASAILKRTMPSLEEQLSQFRVESEERRVVLANASPIERSGSGWQT
jgi:dTDP-4-dehydrorhamnose reductase